MISLCKTIFNLALLGAVVSSELKAQQLTPDATLKSGHGYLLLAVESLGTPPKKILLKGPKVFSSLSIDRFQSGNNYRLLAVPAGRYYYSQVYSDEEKNSAYWEIRNFDYYIDVQENRTSYAGHLISEMYSDQHTDFNFRNRSSQAFRHIQECCQLISKKYPLIFTGSYPDPFLDLLMETPEDR